MEKVSKKKLARKLQHQEARFDRLVSQLAIRGFDFNEPREPKLKQLDQSVFDGVFDWVKSAAISPNGAAYLYSVGKNGFYDVHNEHGFQITGKDKCQCIGFGYDASNWQNSLIERKELTGSDLCRAMLERGDKFILCLVDGRSDNDAINDLEIQVVGGGRFIDFITQMDSWKYAVPINNQGEPLTATDVGL